MMTLYYMEKTFAKLIKQTDKGRTFALEGGQDISEYMMLYKGVPLIENTTMLHEDICKWPLMIKSRRYVIISRNSFR